jgi:hypothetical protein
LETKFNQRKHFLILSLALLPPVLVSWSLINASFMLPFELPLFKISLIVTVIIGLLVVLWQKSSFMLAIILEFLLVGARIGLYAFSSMIKGVELFSGTPPTTNFFYWPLQDGLINLQDLIFASGMLLLVTITIYVLIMERRKIRKGYNRFIIKK